MADRHDEQHALAHGQREHQRAPLVGAQLAARVAVEALGVAQLEREEQPVRADRRNHELWYQPIRTVNVLSYAN